MIDHSGVSLALGARRKQESADASRAPALLGTAGGQSGDGVSVPAKAVCLQDIADKANVSRATVSLALRNHASISLVTRARIQEIATQLDYRPNPLVSALMSYQRAARPARNTDGTLALLLRFSRKGRWRSYLSEHFLRATAERARQHGFRLEEFWLDDLQLSGPRLGEVLYSRCIPGVIVAPLPPGSAPLLLDWSRMSAVTAGSSISLPRLHRVTANCLDGVRQALRRLRRLGYERIGLALRTAEDERADGHWSAGYVSEQLKFPPLDRVPLFLADEGDWNEEAFHDWFRTAEPDAVLSCQPEVISWLEQIGARVPEDAGFVQLSLEGGNGATHTGIDLNLPAIGAAAVDLLVEMVRRNECGVSPSPQTLLLETRWVQGTTTPRRAALSGGFHPGRELKLKPSDLLVLR